MNVAQLISELERLDPRAIVTLGNAPGPLAHITETINGYVIMDKCTQGTCCSEAGAMRAERARGRETRRPAGRTSTLRGGR